MASPKQNPIGYGLMGLTWRHVHNKPDIPLDQILPCMKTALSLGQTVWNGGEFYGTPEKNSLHILKAYFEKYPEDAAKVEINIKGCADPVKLMPDGSREGVRRSVETCVGILPTSVKKIDIFEPARVDPNTPIEETVKYLQECVDEGLIAGIALSEASATTIRRAAKVAKISAVEIELSLWQTDPLTNGITAACKELGIPIHAYSPLGKGAS
jgi:pyridoxine 4-dehydrogenase